MEDRSLGSTLLNTFSNFKLFSMKVFLTRKILSTLLLFSFFLYEQIPTNIFRFHEYVKLWNLEKLIFLESLGQFFMYIFL